MGGPPWPPLLENRSCLRVLRGRNERRAFGESFPLKVPLAKVLGAVGVPLAVRPLRTSASSAVIVLP